MKLINYLLGAALLVMGASCEKTEEGTKEVYPEIETLESTLWYSYNARENIYYDISFEADQVGAMVGYETSSRDNEISRREFTYNYTRATEDYDAIVDVWFEDGQRYGGILVPKGNLQINNKDVYIIQLYELSEDGEEILYDESGNLKSTIMMWKE